MAAASWTRTHELSARTQLGQLVGRSVAMRRAFSILERAAATRATTLLEGETGTGKSAAARALHIEGATAAHPFVTIDCRAAPANLLESELFGHERGAFTSAVAARTGAFEAAGGSDRGKSQVGCVPTVPETPVDSQLAPRSSPSTTSRLNPQTVSPPRSARTPW